MSKYLCLGFSESKIVWEDSGIMFQSREGFEKTLLFLAVAGGIFVPQPGIGPMPPAVEVLSLNHWTVREVPPSSLKKKSLLFHISILCMLFLLTVVSY